MNDIVTNLFAVVIVLGFLVFAHESGHFMFAKLFRVKVLVFSFGFGKRLFGFRKGDTDYRVSLVPLGGYVRMAGDNPEENTAGNPEEFLSKPKWQRFLILVAGPAMNVIIAIAFIAILTMVGSEEVVSAKPVVGQPDANTPAMKAGLQKGDLIVRINNEPIDDFEEFALLIKMNAGTPLRVVYERNGVAHTTTLTPETVEGDFGPYGRAGVPYAGLPPVVGRVEPNSPAAAAGVRADDRIVSVNGAPIIALEEYARLSDAAKTKPMTIVVARGGQQTTLHLAPTAEERFAIWRGILPKTRLFKLSLFPAIRHSVEKNWQMLKFTFAAVGRLFRAEGSVKELSGPINIARISGEMLRRGPFDFLTLMAMISLQLGIMNLLPIPVLDGGHIMILLIEGIARRELSIRVKERIQQAGFAVLATLMLVVLYNDVISNVLRLKNG
ncbi:MAG TPA: RIP metalloprotease RseP [Thermoanaerobaculia bacterium]|jgi:regulator of sigma E protease